jgi:xylulokinase
VLEGVAFGLKDSFTLIQQAGLGKIQQVRISGGGARSSSGSRSGGCARRRTGYSQTTEGAAYGAALLAAVGVGVFQDVPGACRDDIRLTGSTRPGECKPDLPAGLPPLPGSLPGLVRRVFRLSNPVNRQPV